MEEAKALIRMTVRTFFGDPKQIILIDALMLHGVLHLEDIHDLLNIPPKEARGLLQPLREIRLCATHTRKELSLKHNREVNREYYWCKFSSAVNVIKYRNLVLRQQVKTEYQNKSGPDFWLCPRCKSTFGELDIMPSATGDVLCGRCGFVLDVNPAIEENPDAHLGISRLNTQLAKFDALIAAIDRKIERGEFKEPTFDEAFARRKKIPFSISGRTHDNYAEVRRGRERDQAAGAVIEDAINVSITTAAMLSTEEAEREAERKKRIQDTSLLPEWHQGGAIRGSTMDIRGKSSDQKNATVPGFKVEDEEKPALDVKPNIESEKDRAEHDVMEQYMLDMQREQAEADRKRLQEEEDEDDEDDEFEDVPGTGAVGTPMSSQEMNLIAPKSNGLPSQINGLKREFEDDSSEAATPASVFDERDTKKAKIEEKPSSMNGIAATAGTMDDDDSNDEFEDV
jgi:transcription initiation factor TFIIE subunit alpha